MEKQAGEKLESGDFDTAAELYERVVSREPGNAEAVAGLRRAREGVLGNRLLQVRNLRVAASSGPALDRLLEVVQLENRWSMGPAANAQFTQNEETGFALQYFAGEENRLLKANRPLLAEHRFRHYAPVFTGQTHAAAMMKIRRQIQDTGARHCGNFRDTLSNQTPYTNSFARDYCAFWGTPIQKLPASENHRLGALYSGIQFQGDIRGASSADVLAVQTQLTDALRASSWFDAHARGKIPAKTEGEAEFTHRQNLVSLIHEYSAQEPYETTETVTRSREVPYKNPTTGQIDVRTETYQEPQTVVRHRTVTRQYPYSALRHQQSFALRIEVRAKVGSDDFALSLSQTLENVSDEHQLSVADVGLTPKKATLVTPAAWISEQGNALRTQFADSLSRTWIAQNCGSFDAKAGPELTEKLLRCGHDPKGAKTAAVEEWYRTMFDLDSGTTLAMIAGAKKRD